MSESQPRYSTEITDDHCFKYREKIKETKLSLFNTNDLDMLRTTWTGLKYGLFSGVAASIWTINVYPPFVWRNEVESAIKHGTPWVLSFVTYGLTVTTVANIRHKNDYINHFFGGMAAGAVMGSWYKSAVKGRLYALGWGLVGSLMKYEADNPAGTLPPELYSPRPLNFYRVGWFAERPDPEGSRDENQVDHFQFYKP